MEPRRRPPVRIVAVATEDDYGSRSGALPSRLPTAADILAGDTPAAADTPADVAGAAHAVDAADEVGGADTAEVHRQGRVAGGRYIRMDLGTLWPDTNNLPG